MLKQVAGLFVTRVLLRLLNFAIVLLLARWLGPEGQGAFSFMVLMALLLAGFAQLGLDTGVVYFIRARGISSKPLFQRGLPLLMFASCLIIAGVGFARHSGLLPLLDPYNYGLLLSAAFLLANESAGLFLRSFLIAAERFERLNLLDAAQGLLQLLAVSLALVFDPSADAALAAYVAARIAGSLLVLFSIRVEDQGDEIGLADLLRYSRYPWISNLFSMLNVRVDTLMLGWFLGLAMGVTAEDLGLYTVCAMAINAIKEIQLAVQKVFLPKVSASSDHESCELTARLYRQSFLIYSMIGLSIIALSRPALLLFGPEYVRAWPALAILIIGVVLIRANGGLLSLHLTACGKPSIPPRLNGYGVLLNVCLNLFLIPRFGIEGAALATALSALVVKTLFIKAYLDATGQRWRADLRLKAADWMFVKSRLRSLLHKG